MANNAPSYRLLLGSRDMTPTIDPRLISLTLTECRGGEADQLDLTLSDHDGLLEIPSKGVELALSIGWAGADLVDKGTFTVREVEHSGAPDVVTIRARSADMGEKLRTRKDRSYHATTIGAIVSQIATRHKLKSRVDAALARKAIAHIDQTSESDMAFATRLARLHDAVATVKAGTLLFLPILGTTTSTGKPMPTVKLTRASGDTHNYTSGDREAYSGVRAYWHDPKRAKRRGVLVGASGNAKRLRDSFGSEADARAAAVAEWRRIQRGAATFGLTLALGEPLLAPQAKLQVSGFKPVIDATEWLVKQATHSFGGSGYTTHVELETADADKGEGGTVADDSNSPDTPAN